MRKIVPYLMMLALAPAAFAVDSGKPAPDFTAKTSDGKTVKLSDYTKQGKTVVLEWLNHGCPFVKKHYDSKNMQSLQEKYTKAGVVWLSVISSAPGKQGHGDAKQVEADRKKLGANPSAILIDDKGEVGKLYGAQTTPHMYVIDKTGKLVYQGAIDDKATTEVADLKGATNYVSAAVDAVTSIPPKPVAVAQTKAYGCGVKYN